MYAEDLSGVSLVDVASIFTDALLLTFDVHEEDNALILASWLDLWCTWINMQRPEKADLQVELDS